MLVDSSTMRQPFVQELLSEMGEVKQYDGAPEALAAIKHGAKVDALVVGYRLATGPVIHAVRHHNPKAVIIAFGMPRPDVPPGVDRYLIKPILAIEVRSILEQMLGG